MVEPVQGSNPTLDCRDFLAELIEVCRDAGVLVMFDEVITGFRLAYGGAQEEMDLRPDLAAYGKTLGGGMPVGAVAGRADLMSRFDWHRQRETGGRVFAGGTFGGNPVTMSAGAATLNHLKSHPEIYERLREHGRRLREEIGGFCVAEGFPAQVMSAHSMIHLRFQSGPILSARDIDRRFAAAEKEFYTRVMLNGGADPGRPPRAHVGRALAPGHRHRGRRLPECSRGDPRPALGALSESNAGGPLKARPARSGADECPAAREPEA